MRAGLREFRSGNRAPSPTANPHSPRQTAVMTNAFVAAQIGFQGRQLFRIVRHTSKPLRGSEASKPEAVRYSR